MTEIQCTPDCAYLSLARAHPPAAAVRARQHDMGIVLRVVRDFSERQSQLFLMVASFLAKFPSEDLQPLIDDDVAEASAALAGTFETAARGVIYDHRPASLPAERLMAGLKPLLVDAARGGGSSGERDVAAVLRRVHDAVGEARAAEPENRRAFLDLLRRVVGKAPEASPDLIIP
jgi:hypothetical protein